MSFHHEYLTTNTATSKWVNVSATMATLDTLPSHAGETEASFMASGSPRYLYVLQFLRGLTLHINEATATKWCKNTVRLVDGDVWSSNWGSDGPDVKDRDQVKVCRTALDASHKHYANRCLHLHQAGKFELIAVGAQIILTEQWPLWSSLSWK